GAASEAVHRGQRVTCAFLRFDTWNLEARLSLRAMRPDPFQAFADRTPVGGRLRGQVTELVPFGVFVRVADGIEGLVHLTELARTPVPAPEEAVRVGTARARRWKARARLGAAPFPHRGTGAKRRDRCGKGSADRVRPPAGGAGGQREGAAGLADHGDVDEAAVGQREGARPGLLRRGGRLLDLPGPGDLGGAGPVGCGDNRELAR